MILFFISTFFCLSEYLNHEVKSGAFYFYFISIMAIENLEKALEFSTLGF
jgi:hypothetical protein